MTDVVAHGAALEPLRASLTARANREAEAMRAAADEDGRRAVAAAREQAAAVLAEARARGAADAAALLADERARARRAARSVVLDAQRAAYHELREQAHQSVRRLLDDPRWRKRLITAIGRELGGSAVIREHPAGGVIAEASDGRSVDASADALVEGVLANLDLEQLWAAR